MPVRVCALLGGREVTGFRRFHEQLWTLYRAADRAMYILTEGQMEIVRPGSGSGDRRVALIDPGSVFGEQAFVDASPRSASVSAITDCTALRLTPEGFTQLQANEPEIAFQLLLDIARVLSHRLRGR